MKLRTSFPILIASAMLVGFAPATFADDADTATGESVPTTARSAPTLRTMVPAVVPTTTTTVPPPPEPVFTAQLTTEPTTTEPVTIEPPTTEPVTTEPSTTEPVTVDPPTTTEAPPTTVETTSPTELPETTTTTTETPETTTSETTTTETTTTTTTPPPEGEITLTTSSITGTEASLSTRTVRLTFSVTVTDTRTAGGGWTASAHVSNLVGATEGQTLPSSFTYSSPSTSCSASAGSLTLGANAVVVHRSNEPCSASWTVTVNVELPEGADIADLYSATVEHSLSVSPEPTTQSAGDAS